MNDVDAAIKSIEGLVKKVQSYRKVSHQHGKAWHQHFDGGKPHEHQGKPMSKDIAAAIESIMVLAEKAHRRGKGAGRGGSDVGTTRHRLEFSNGTYKIVKPDGDYARTVGGQIWRHPDARIAGEVLRRYSRPGPGIVDTSVIRNKLKNRDLAEQRKKEIAQQTRKMPKPMRGVMGGGRARGLEGGASEDMTDEGRGYLGGNPIGRLPRRRRA